MIPAMQAVAALPSIDREKSRPSSATSVPLVPEIFTEAAASIDSGPSMARHMATSRH
jgi:hypothetical protein